MEKFQFFVYVYSCGYACTALVDTLFLFLLLKAVGAISSVHKKINFRLPIQNFEIGHNHQ